MTTYVDLAREIAQRFGWQIEGDLQPVIRQEWSSYIVKVPTSEGAYAVKFVEALMPADQVMVASTPRVAFEAECEAAGVRIVRPVADPVTGERIFKLETTPLAVRVHEWLEGPVGIPFHGVGTGGATRLAKLLADLHRVGRTHSGEIDLRSWNHLDHYPPFRYINLPDVEAVGRLDELKTLVALFTDYFEDAQNWGMCHSDLTRNVISSGGKFHAFDFDSAGPFPVAFETLGLMVAAADIYPPSSEVPNDKAEVAATFLRTYLNEIPDSAQEIATAALALDAGTVIGRAAWGLHTNKSPNYCLDIATSVIEGKSVTGFGQVIQSVLDQPLRPSAVADAGNDMI